jgi:hypothetical protein
MAAQVVTDIQAFSQRDISNTLTMVDAKATPFFSMIPKGSQSYGSVLMEYPMDKNLDPVHTAITDNTDVSTFENALSSYGQGGNYQQWFRPPGWQVGKIAQTVQNLPGVGNPKAKQMAKKIIQLKRMLEASLGTDMEPRAWGGAQGGVSRGAGNFIKATAQTTLPIPTQFLTASGCIDTTASASVTETIVQNILQASWNETGQKLTRDLLCGGNHRKQYRSFMEKSSGSTNTQSSSRAFNNDATNGTIKWTVDTYQGDFGTFNIQESQWLAYYDTTDTTKTADSDSTQNSIRQARAYGLNLELWEWVGKQAPMHVDLPDLGGGPRGAVDAIGGLKCYNPRAEIKFAGTT